MKLLGDSKPLSPHLAGVTNSQKESSPTPSKTDRERFLERTVDELHNALVKGNHQLAMVLVKDARKSRE